MFLSCKLSLAEANTGKRTKLREFLDASRQYATNAIPAIWARGDCAKFAPKAVFGEIPSTLSGRSLSNLRKNIVGVSNSVLRRIAKLERKATWREGQRHFKKARELKAKAEKLGSSCPDVSKINVSLDYRNATVDISEKPGRTYQGWIDFNFQHGNRFSVPFIRHPHFESLLRIGKLRPGGILTEDFFIVIFETDKVPNEGKKVIGIDIGLNGAITTSNGLVISDDPSGHTYKTITEKICRKQPGSKAFRRAIHHRDSYCAWAVKQIPLEGVGKLVHEDLKHMKSGRKIGRNLKHWSPSSLIFRLGIRCGKLGVERCAVYPTFTSQRCSACGWVRKHNRKGSQFVCDRCGFAAHADVNGARNIKLQLPSLTKKQRRLNRTGFYWAALGQIGPGDLE